MIFQHGKFLIELHDVPGEPHNTKRLTARVNPDSVVPPMDAKTRKQLENLLFRLTHRDFKGGKGDDRTVLRYVTGVGTCTVSLAAFTDEDLTAQLKGFGNRKLLTALEAPLRKLTHKASPSFRASDIEWAALHASLATAIVEGQGDAELLETARTLVSALEDAR